MKICIIGYSFNHPTSNRLLSFFSYFSKQKGIQIDIIAPREWDGYVFPDYDKYLNKNMKMHFLDVLHFDTKPHSQFRFMYKGLKKKIKEIDPDIVFCCNEPIALCNFQALRAAHSLGKKIGFSCWENMDFPHNFVVNMMEKSTLDNSDFLMMGTEQVKETYLGRGADKNKMSIVPEAGINTAFYREQKPSKELLSRLGLRKKGLGSKNKKDDLVNVIYIGRIIKVKGIETLIKAAEILDKKNVRYRLIIIGFGRLNDKSLNIKVKEYIKSRKNSKVKNNKIKNEVIYLEDLENKYVPETYNLCDILVYPSVPDANWREQFGYSIVEAMSCGLPCISTKSGGPQTIIVDGKTGLLVEPDNEEEVAKSMKKLIESKKLREKFGKAGMIRAEKVYSFEAVAKKQYNVLKKYANKS